MKTVSAATPAALPEERTQSLLQRVTHIYVQNLANAETARDWLSQHGLTDYALLDRHAVGASNGLLPDSLPQHDTIAGELIQLRILSEKRKERFAYCVVFPTMTADGQHGNFWAYPKDTRVRFLPERPFGLWNITAAKTSSHLLITPDVLDALAVITAGHTNAVALHPVHGTVDLPTLSEWGVQRLTILVGSTPDALAVAEKLKAKVAPHPCAVAILRGYSGASALLRALGPKALAEAVVAATHGLVAVTIPGMQPLPGGFTLTIGSRRYEIRGLESSARRLKCTIRAERGGKLHVDTLDFYHARARRQLAIELVRLFEEAADVIEADVAKLLTACEARVAQPDLTASNPAPDAIPEADRKEAEAMARDPKLIAIIQDDYDCCGLVGERPNRLLAYIAMTSRKLKKPLALMNLSSSGAGKSTLQDAVIAFCPPEDLVEVTNLSAKALFHREATSLKHKVLALKEDEGAQGAAYSLRNLISDGYLITEVATKDPASGKLITMRNRVEGPVAVLLTTTAPDTEAETRSRFLIISTDESREQTRAILEHQRKLKTIEGLIAEKEIEAIKRRHHALQRLLQPMRVFNPLALRLTYADDKLTSRRDQDKMLRLIDAVALLRQFQKPIKQHEGVNYIEVDDLDMRIAAELMRDVLAHNFSELSRPGHELLSVLAAMRSVARRDADPAAKPAPFEFTRREIREHAGWAQARIHRYITELIDLEYVLRQRAHRGLQERYVLNWDGQADRPVLMFPFDDLAVDASRAKATA